MDLFEQFSLIGRHYSEAIAEQHTQVKEKYPDTLILFRIGDFYEAYNKDAETISEVLGTNLIKREEVSVTGFGAIALEKSLQKLVGSGRRVGIANP